MYGSNARLRGSWRFYYVLLRLLCICNDTTFESVAYAEYTLKWDDIQDTVICSLAPQQSEVLSIKRHFGVVEKNI